MKVLALRFGSTLARVARPIETLEGVGYLVQRDGMISKLSKAQPHRYLGGMGQLALLLGCRTIRASWFKVSYNVA